MQPIVDGIVRLRPPEADDAATLIESMDAESSRWLGGGSPAPSPAACVEVADEVVGWVDYDIDPDHTWLGPGEVNLGYCLFPIHRGRGFATRAVQLLMHHLALEGRYDTATLLIDPQNTASLGVAARAGFELRDEIDRQLHLVRAVPPLSYSDGVVTIRRQDPSSDLTPHLEAIDHEQIEWLWLPGQRESWEAMTPAAQQDHQRRHLQASHDEFGSGPDWRFSVDSAADCYVAYVDCNLANPHVAAGDANIAYAARPGHRGKGYVARAVHLVTRFLGDHTGARVAYLVIDEANVASLRVAASVGAIEDPNWRADDGTAKVRFRLDLRPVTR